MRKFSVLLACLLLAGLLPATAGATFQRSHEQLWLETASPGNPGLAPPVSTSGQLRPGAFYFVDVQGTLSAWSVSQWATNGFCGLAPESAPMFPSPGIPNGPAASDAEVLFSAAGGSSRCTAGYNAPVHDPKFEIDRGSGFAHNEPVGGPFSAATPNHKYRYVIQGQGSNATFSFRFFDIPSRDNYGRLKINVYSTTVLDCLHHGWRDFGVFRNVVDCALFYLTKGKNPPSGP